MKINLKKNKHTYKGKSERREDVSTEAEAGVI